MHLSDRFLFLHLPKTGGWTVRRILAGAGLEHTDLHLNQHAALHEISERWRCGKQVIATVREPCAWYRSYFHYNVRRDGTMSPFIRELLGDEPFELKRALHAMLFPDPKGPPMRMLGIGQRASPGLLAERQMGPYSWMVANQLGREPNALHPVPGTWVIDTDSLRTGLQQAMKRLDLDLGPAVEDVPNDNCNVELVAQGRMLLPYERPLLEDFDDEMVGWVYEREHAVVRLMGYTGPGSTARTSLVEAPDPATWVTGRIAQLLELEEGWYWHGEGKPIDPELLAQVQRVLELLERMDQIYNLSRPYIFPSIDGTVSLEWDGYWPRCSASIDFGADDEIDGSLLVGKGAWKHLTLPLDTPDEEVAQQIYHWLSAVTPGASP